MKLPHFANFGDYFYWCYANWMMYCAACREEATKYKGEGQRNYYNIRTKYFDRLKKGEVSVKDLLQNNVWKVEEGADHCWYCGVSVNDVKITKDHILPLDKGGDDTFDNIAMVCQHCNSSKSNKDLVVWFKEKYKTCPPMWIYGLYIKLVYQYSESHNLFTKKLDQIDCLDLPFYWKSLYFEDIAL